MELKGLSGVWLDLEHGRETRRSRRTNARALKKLTSNRPRHSSGVLSAIRFTGDKVPWLTIRLSSLEKRLMVVSTAFGPTL